MVFLVMRILPVFSFLRVLSPLPMRNESGNVPLVGPFVRKETYLTSDPDILKGSQKATA